MKVDLSPQEIRALRAAAMALVKNPPEWAAWTPAVLTPQFLARLDACEREAWNEVQTRPVKEPTPMVLAAGEESTPNPKETDG